MRVYSEWSTEVVREQLAAIADSSLSVPDYRRCMRALGDALGAALANLIPPKTPLTVACTPEDADFLALGVISQLSQASLAVLWVERGESALRDFANVYKRFVEPQPAGGVLLIVKSIIASSCTVRAGIAELYSELQPSRILIAAPVILKGADARLDSEFPNEISSKFDYRWFAQDDEQVGEVVIPGIGGSVYRRLDIDPGSYVPQLLIERRKLRAAA